jgi:hypothetical protein
MPLNKEACLDNNLYPKANLGWFTFESSRRFGAGGRSHIIIVLPPHYVFVL